MEAKEGGYYIVETKNTLNARYMKFFIIERTEKTILFKNVDQMEDNKMRLAHYDFENKFKIVEEIQSPIEEVLNKLKKTKGLSID